MLSKLANIFDDCVSGRIKVDMNKVGSEENTTFTNSSLPALERRCSSTD
jgi:hypothetical protein